MRTDPVKTLAAFAVALLAFLLAIPLLLSGDNPIAGACVTAGTPVEAILATIRTIESGGDYHAQAAGSTASGAYQFLDSTWANYAGYLHAKDAPDSIQDERASRWVTQILSANTNDVTAVPVTWYIGHVPRPGAGEWDQIPAGNTLTPRQYQARWLATYQQLAATTVTTTPTSTTPTSTTAATVTGVPMAGSEPSTSTTTMPAAGCRSIPTLDGYALPIDRAILEHDPSRLNAPHHDYPAIDYPVPVGTAVYAAHAGIVEHLSTYSDNCYTTPTSCRDLCGLGISIRDRDGVSWIYCHASRLAVAVGDTIAAGQQIMSSGNSGHSSGPHLHFGIRIGGIDHCPQPLLTALYTTGKAIAPAELPTGGCTYNGTV